MMVRAENTTLVWTQVLGLDADATYGSHVHDLPYSFGGGGHYKIDPNEPETVEENELWPTLVTGADGIGYGYDETLEHTARPEAQSIVVHDHDGQRLAIADLRGQAIGDPNGSGTSTTPQIATGTFVTTEDGVDLGYNISGSVQLVRAGGVTWVRSNARGLTPETTYGSHVHTLPSEFNGGGHYKIDPTIEETVESNEIWPAITTDIDGNGRGEDHRMTIARPEAQSVVIHEPELGTKIAIADLETNRRSRFLKWGRFVNTAEGAARGFNISGWARFIRNADQGTTTVTASVSGLTPGMTFSSHVHVQPAYTGGGGHYKIDPSINETLEENEIWLSFAADRKGRAKDTVLSEHFARPEAQSLVIHDPEDGSRIAILSLE